MHVPTFEGIHIFKANKIVIEPKEQNLLSSGELIHSYLILFKSTLSAEQHPNGLFHGKSWFEKESFKIYR